MSYGRNCYVCGGAARVLYPVVVEGNDRHICSSCLKEEMNE